MSESKNCRCGGCTHLVCENRREHSHSPGESHEHHHEAEDAEQHSDRTSLVEPVQEETSSTTTI